MGLILVQDELNQLNRNIKAGFGDTKRGLDDLIGSKSPEASQ